MRKILCGAGGFILYSVLVSIFIAGSFGDPKEICQPRNVSYKIADTNQCDMYHECGKSSKGKTLERLCDDGFVFSEEIHACDYPHNVNCSGRELLQESLSTNPFCERMNGFYPFPPADSCQKFYHCLEGKAYEKTCADGVIFDPAVGACIHPDRSRRPDCAAKSVLNFTCPNSGGKKFVRLRFGNHDRLPHSTNCRKFFICLADGKPRVGGCPLGKVFNPKLGVCDSPLRVPQCKDYYGKKDLKKLAKLAELGEEASVDDVEDEIESTEDEEHEHEEQEHQQQEPVPAVKSKNKVKFQQSKRDTSQQQQQQPSTVVNGPAQSLQGLLQDTQQQKGSQEEEEDLTDDDDDADDDTHLQSN